ncbi:RNA polymerase subunit omega 1 [Bacillus carboniphilus]|uniref:DNA-directed RNA polymerase subunit epsilon n=1 Tax=Bacillus carboniphilus TaxID=86663 RepID=A0ABN0W4Q1_9BACI
MIFKVYYQESKAEVPVREHTKTLYMEAETEREVRLALDDKNFNIEFVQPTTGAYLEYEQQSEDFKVLEKA